MRIFFGCHARPDRSFYFRGRQFPICARCTGELVGMFIGVFAAICYGCLDFWIACLMMLPLIVDGFVQRLTAYESNNLRRLWTGILFGIAFIFMFIYFHRACVHIAGWILKLFCDPQKVDSVMERFV
ncbi:MAG: DUF2085 domain-containing protein [Muribaculum sp.]|nr:DUF2085 domain-containing protein [Muribaculum sp.]